uniref:Uncharacterized protein n=1 Tax=Schistocephalus solidus TaxID=70667 RepID=A0A0X3NLW9_SCHSO
MKVILFGLKNITFRQILKPKASFSLIIKCKEDMGHLSNGQPMFTELRCNYSGGTVSRGTRTVIRTTIPTCGHFTDCFSISRKVYLRLFCEHWTGLVAPLLSVT